MDLKCFEINFLERGGGGGGRGSRVAEMTFNGKIVQTLCNEWFGFDFRDREGGGGVGGGGGGG